MFQRREEVRAALKDVFINPLSETNMPGLIGDRDRDQATVCEFLLQG